MQDCKTHGGRVTTIWRALALVMLTAMPGAAAAQEHAVVTGKVDWGLWIDPDGCMHWWSDGGLEGYMTPRRDPRTGRHMCLSRATCAVPGTDALFAGETAVLTAGGQAWLQKFFATKGAVAYAIYGHTDKRGSSQYSRRLSQKRADVVAAVARGRGATLERVVGLGDSRPVARNNSPANMQKNRRVEIICFRYP